MPPRRRENGTLIKRKILSFVLAGTILAGAAGIAVAAETASTNIATLSVAEDRMVEQGALENEKVLVLRGSWIKETSHKVEAELEGKAVNKSEVTWSVDTDSYQNEFGFTGNLTGDDIVFVDPATGRITAKHSGIVRIWCTSNSNPEDKTSLIVVVPGDVNRDGVVDLEDAMRVIEYANGDESETMNLITDDEAMYQFELANIAEDDVIDLEDAMAIINIANGDSKI